VRISLRWAVGVPVVIAMVCLGALLLRLYQVHEQGWEWRLSPSAAPPRISFDGRDYLGSPAPAGVPARDVQQGRTPGGGVIFANRDLSLTQTVIWVKTASGSFVYSLQGGP
jgi:hypothetical protein